MLFQKMKKISENVVDYYPYGKVLRAYQNGQQERYLTTGNERDRETGWDFRNARSSDADIVRFNQIDPRADDLAQWSSYVYVGDNPVSLKDPNGDCPWCIGAFIGAVTDIAIQGAEIYLDDSKSFDDFSFTSVGISAAAGATGVGLASKISKMGTLAKIGTEVAFDAAASAGNSICKRW
jgi:RHS repeat-associated protein